MATAAFADSVLQPEAARLLREFLKERTLFAPRSKEPFLDITQVTEFLDVLETERNAWRRQKQLLFHPYFGSEFTSGTSPTLFAMMVTRYVDVYTSRVSNFLRYPGDYRFYPEMKLLPHQQPHNSTLAELEPAEPAGEST
jgi:hypothetical protein